MREIRKKLSQVEDRRQEKKVRHKMSENISKTNISLKAKRFTICLNAEKYLEMVIQL